MRYDDSRFLAGPNRFALGPVAQVRIRPEPEERLNDIAAGLQDAADEVLALTGPAGDAVVRPGPTMVAVGLSAPNRAWATWRPRRLAERVGLDPDEIAPEPAWPIGGESDAPEPASVPVAAITGTNGKSTTTRLLARIAIEAGFMPGVTASDGVWVDGRQVLTGDYTGPQGAARALCEPGVNLGVLEVARGGLLLKGLGLPVLESRW